MKAVSLAEVVTAEEEAVVLAAAISILIAAIAIIILESASVDSTARAYLGQVFLAPDTIAIPAILIHTAIAIPALIIIRVVIIILLLQSLRLRRLSFISSAKRLPLHKHNPYKPVTGITAAIRKVTIHTSSNAPKGGCK